MQNPTMPQVGSATAVAGTVVVLRDYEGVCSLPVVLNAGDPIYLGDTIVTNTDGRARVTLSDTTVLSVGSSAVDTVNPHDPTSHQSPLEQMWGPIHDWIQDLLQDPDRKPNSVGGGGGVIGDLAYPNGNTVGLSSSDDWWGYDSGFDYFYDPYDGGSYYDLGGGGGSGGYDDGCDWCWYDMDF